MLFFIGLHQPSDAKHFARCMISVNRLQHRVKDFQVQDWILDSGAFTRLWTGKGHLPVEEYARLIKRWSLCGNLLAAVSQDFMCEPAILARTGLSVQEHQALTITNYQRLLQMDVGTYIMPVLQGYRSEEYVRHLHHYGQLIAPDSWVGLGSVCKRNRSPWEVMDILLALQEYRPDLKIHGFGVKTTILRQPLIARKFYSADSMAWSFASRYRSDGNANDWREAQRWLQHLNT